MRPVETPNAPTSRLSRRRSAIRRASSGRGARRSNPMAPIRSVPWPTTGTTLTASPAARRRSSQEPKPVQSHGIPGARNAAHSRRRPPPAGAGAGEKPHIPVTSVVTPWRTFDSAEGTWRSEKSEWACMSMKPGVTKQPVASTTPRASPAKPGSTAATRSPRSTTSVGRASAPVPSRTLPPRISQSNATRDPTR